MGISDFTSKMIGEKRRWRQYKARAAQLPPAYRTAINALERYLLYFGPGDGTTMAVMFEDLADLFEQSIADGAPVRSIVGDDPVEFAEAFLRNYPNGSWVVKERQRLVKAIKGVTDQQETP
ncbi:DUF1048 domain-containing protein [Psychromicrobium sp. YIM B11713]|uniref:DUF1048 domain-containing protein n=1 Tax=Psychromicrobium sp. YIM B11713 TaxID=3145233 RepID=UPI00374FB7F0